MVGDDRLIAHRLPADVPGSRQIPLHQRRRHAQHVRDIVEAAAFVVGRQHRRRVDIHGRAGRGSRWRIRCDSGDAWSRARDWAWPHRRGRARFRRYDASPSSVALSGRGMPCGGIAPTRSLRITFSQVSAPFGTSTRLAPCSERPPVRSLSLWQVTQYRLSSAACCADLAGSPEFCARATLRKKPRARVNPSQLLIFRGLMITPSV